MRTRSSPKNPVYWVELEHVHTKAQRSKGPFHFQKDCDRWLKMNQGQLENARVYRIRGGVVGVNVKGHWVLITGDEEIGALMEIQRISGKTLLEMVV